MSGTCWLFPLPFPFQYSYIFVHFSPFHWLFIFFSSRQLKRYLKLLLVYFYFSFAICVSSCQTRQQHCSFCNGIWLQSKWLVLGLKWSSQFRISCHHARAGNLVAHAMGCWLHGSSQSGLTTSVWANNEITKLIHMQKKASKKHQRTKAGSGAVRDWLQEGGGCSAASAQHVHACEEGCFGPASDLAPACEIFSNFDLKWSCFGLSGSCFSQALAASGKLLPAVKAALACFDAVPTSHFEAALLT